MPGLYVGFDPVMIFVGIFLVCAIGYILFGRHNDEA